MEDGTVEVKAIRSRRRRTGKTPTVVLTIGHSTLALDRFILLLKAHEVARVVDVRTIPRSRHNPQFNKETLPDCLRAAGVAYEHMPGLGGLRHTRADSPNKGWRNASFRGFADYMQTREFVGSLKALLDLARKQRVALMCAEAVPWRCHRSLIADALTVRGIRVEHILSGTRTQAHALTPWACVRGRRIIYPAQETSETDLVNRCPRKHAGRRRAGRGDREADAPSVQAVRSPTSGGPDLRRSL